MFLCADFNSARLLLAFRRRASSQPATGRRTGIQRTVVARSTPIALVTGIQRMVVVRFTAILRPMETPAPVIRHSLQTQLESVIQPMVFRHFSITSLVHDPTSGREATTRRLAG